VNQLSITGAGINGVSKNTAGSCGVA